MEQDFYVGRLREHGLDVLTPDAADRKIVHDVIYDELCRGIVKDESRDEYRRIMRGLAERGAQGILLGCTEIDLLVGADDSPVPVFDTTRLHAERAVELSLWRLRRDRLRLRAPRVRDRQRGEHGQAGGDRGDDERVGVGRLGGIARSPRSSCRPAGSRRVARRARRRASA